MLGNLSLHKDSSEQVISFFFIGGIYLTKLTSNNFPMLKFRSKIVISHYSVATSQNYATFEVRIEIDGPKTNNKDPAAIF